MSWAKLVGLQQAWLLDELLLLWMGVTLKCYVKRAKMEGAFKKAKVKSD